MIQKANKDFIYTLCLSESSESNKDFIYIHCISESSEARKQEVNEARTGSFAF